jgi:uncharacterized protein (TIGR00251 family)
MAEVSTRLRLRVSPRAARTELVGRYGDSWKLRVGEAAERGRANDALVAFLAERLGVMREQVTLVSGHAARDKIVEVRGLQADEAERRLAGQAVDAPPQPKL